MHQPTCDSNHRFKATHLFAALSLMAGCVISRATAQCPPVFTFNAPAGDSLFGTAVAGIGDINGDGIGDMALASPVSSAGGASSGAIYLHSGSDGALLRTLAGPPFAAIGWSIAAAGDVNNDGVPDVLAGNPNYSSSRGIAIVFSGADGSIIHQLLGAHSDARLGCALSGMGDLNGDGHTDVAIAADHENNQFFLPVGRVRIYSGADGSVLHTFSGASVNQAFGSAVASMNDINGDGCSELIVTARDPQNSAAAHLFVYSGCSGGLLHAKARPPVTINFGARIAGLDDVDGDRVADFALTLQLATEWRVAIYSGATAEQISYTVIDLNTKQQDEDGPNIQSKISLAAGQFGVSRSMELLFGNAHFNFGRAFVIEPGSSSIAQRQYLPVHVTPNDFGASVASAGDVTGDGRHDIIIGAPQMPGGGKVFVYRSVTLGDLNCDGSVNVNDLLTVINTWIPPYVCPPYVAGDANWDCQVNVNDLLLVINNWG